MQKRKQQQIPVQPGIQPHKYTNYVTYERAKQNPFDIQCENCRAYVQASRSIILSILVVGAHCSIENREVLEVLVQLVCRYYLLSLLISG